MQKFPVIANWISKGSPCPRIAGFQDFKISRFQDFKISASGVPPPRKPITQYFDFQDFEISRAQPHLKISFSRSSHAREVLFGTSRSLPTHSEKYTRRDLLVQMVPSRAQPHLKISIFRSSHAREVHFGTGSSFTVGGSGRRVGRGSGGRAGFASKP